MYHYMLYTTRERRQDQRIGTKEGRTLVLLDEFAVDFDVLVVHLAHDDGLVRDVSQVDGFGFLVHRDAAGLPSKVEFSLMVVVHLYIL